jgi:hypothetical protein
MSAEEEFTNQEAWIKLMEQIFLKGSKIAIDVKDFHLSFGDVEVELDGNLTIVIRLKNR